MKWYDKNLLLIFLALFPIWIMGLIVFDILLFPLLKLGLLLNVVIGFIYGIVSTSFLIKIYDRFKFHMPDYHSE